MPFLHRFSVRTNFKGSINLETQLIADRSPLTTGATVGHRSEGVFVIQPFHRTRHKSILVRIKQFETSNRTIKILYIQTQMFETYDS